MNIGRLRGLVQVLSNDVEVASHAQTPTKVGDMGDAVGFNAEIKDGLVKTQSESAAPIDEIDSANFDRPEEVAEEVDEKNGSSKPVRIVPVQTNGSLPTIYFIHALGPGFGTARPSQRILIRTNLCMELPQWLTERTMKMAILICMSRNFKHTSRTGLIT